MKIKIQENIKNKENVLKTLTAKFKESSKELDSYEMRIQKIDKNIKEMNENIKEIDEQVTKKGNFRINTNRV